MGNRIFVAVVILIWLGATSWLVVNKILPPFYYGEPPAAARATSESIVCWRVFWGTRRVGWAASQTTAGVLGTTELHSRVVLDSIPLSQLAPAWMGSLVREFGEIDLDARTRVEFDALDNFSAFATSVQINELPGVIKMTGRAKDSQLELQITSGKFSFDTQRAIPQNVFLANELAPEPLLPNMYVGRKWTKEIYSPFRAPGDPVELLEAEVVEEGPVTIGQTIHNTHRVEYRSISAVGVATKATVRATLWVANDGTVLRQETNIMNSKLRFDRAADDDALATARELIDLTTFASQVPPE